jgi:hypothetical protein
MGTHFLHGPVEAPHFLLRQGQLVIAVDVIHRRQRQKPAQSTYGGFPVRVITVEQISRHKDIVRLRSLDLVQKVCLHVAEVLALQVGHIDNARAPEILRHPLRVICVLCRDYGFIIPAQKATCAVSRGRSACYH